MKREGWIELIKDVPAFNAYRSENFDHPNLSGANLSGANLSGANLRDAYLSGANLSGARGLSVEIVTPLMMLLDQPGKIRAYKLVNAKMEGPYNGGIKYEIGKTVEVKNVNTDIWESCGSGVNVATLDWCLREWGKGYRILICEFTAKDIAAIPVASDGKFRLHRCKVVGEKKLPEGFIEEGEDSRG